MNQQDSSSNSLNDSSRCRHYTEAGRRCRLRVLDTRSGLCFRHAALLEAPTQPSDSTDLSAELLGDLPEFTSASDIRQFLSRLLTQVTKGRVSPRRASVLAYITNQLLHSHRAIDRELVTKEKSEPIEFDFSDWPSGGPAVFRRAMGLIPEDPERAMYKRLARLAPNDPDTSTTPNNVHAPNTKVSP